MRRRKRRGRSAAVGRLRPAVPLTSATTALTRIPYESPPAVTAAVAQVDTRACRGCGQCVSICDFQAPSLAEVEPGVFLASINPSLCKGCGTCASWCPSGAITARHFTDQQVVAMIDAFFADDLPVEEAIP